jgi:hypothetical protein
MSPFAYVGDESDCTTSQSLLQARYWQLLCLSSDRLLRLNIFLAEFMCLLAEPRFLASSDTCTSVSACVAVH